jgi:hypothetical protein
VGQTLTANPSLNGSGTISYQWLRGGSPISGATGSSYTLVSTDQGAYIKVRVTRSGYTGSVESSQTGPVTGSSSSTLTGSVSISGTAQVGQTLTASSSLNGSGTISYQWLRGGSTISGATGSSYTLVSTDQGSYIKVRVTRSGYTGSVESSQTGPVTGSSNPPSSGNDTLTLSNGPISYAVYVTSATLNSNSSYLTIASDYTNLKATGIGSGNSAALTWTSGGTGSYSVLIYVATETRYQNGVSFSNGSGSLNWNNMSTASGGSGGGTFTISGLPQGSIATVSVSTGNPTSYTNFATNVSWNVGTGAITSGAACTWTITPPDGTYTIVLAVIDASSYTSTYHKATNVSISGGSGSVAYSSFTTSPLN